MFSSLHLPAPALHALTHPFIPQWSFGHYVRVAAVSSPFVDTLHKENSNFGMCFHTFKV